MWRSEGTSAHMVHERLGVSAEEISEFCRRWNVTEFAVFGSAVRDDFNDESDIDVLVSFAPDYRPSGLDVLAMEEELVALFGRSVDLVEKGRIGPNPFRRHNILAEHRVIYPEPFAPGERIAEGPSTYHRDLSYVWDIVQAGRKIMEMSQRDEVPTDILRLACERELITIGEAVRGLSAAFKAAYPEIPWSSIISERNIIVHNYRGVEEEKVWTIAIAAVPVLVKQFAPLVATTPP